MCCIMEGHKAHCREECYAEDKNTIPISLYFLKVFRHYANNYEKSSREFVHFMPLLFNCPCHHPCTGCQVLTAG